MTRVIRSTLPALCALLALGCGNRPAPPPPAAAPAEPAQPTARAPDAPPARVKEGKVGTFPDEQIEVAGKQRAYRLVVPASVKPERPAPLVFAFHGFLDSKDLMPFYSGLGDLARREGFILVYPDGQNRAWPIVLDWARDDLAFFDALHDRLADAYNIDPDRVYLTGMSNGAYFCHLLASQRSDRVAAIAAHSGGLGLLALIPPAVKRKYAVLLIHGSADTIVSVEESRKARDAYRKWGHPVEYVEVPGLNHFWAHSAHVNARIWAFFKAHPRQ